MTIKMNDGEFDDRFDQFTKIYDELVLKTNSTHELPQPDIRHYHSMIKALLIAYDVIEIIPENENELKSCPKCGSVNIHYIVDGNKRYPHYVKCFDCNNSTIGTAFKNDEFNREEWNKMK